MDYKLTQSHTNTIRVKYLVAAIVWMALIFIVSGIPSEHIPKAGVWDLLVKKGAHMAAYALLAVLWRRALGENRLSWLMAFAITVLYAVSDEYHQTFVPGRNGAFIDVLVDSAGALASLVIMRARSKKASPHV